MAKDDELFRQVMEDVTETLTANLREVLDAGAGGTSALRPSTARASR